MAAQDKSVWDGALSTYINDNTSEEITPDDVRTVFGNMSDSVLWNEGSSSLTAVTPATDDKVVIRDTSDSDNLKTVTAQSIADLASTSGVLKTTISVSSAEILALNTTPKELIAAQGSGKLLFIQNMLIDYTYAAAAYATNTTLRFTLSSNVLDAPNVINQTSDRVRGTSLVAPPLGAKADFTNQPFNLTVASGNPTAGSGTLDITIYYTVEDV